MISRVNRRQILVVTVLTFLMSNQAEAVWLFDNLQSTNLSSTAEELIQSLPQHQAKPIAVTQQQVPQDDQSSSSASQSTGTAYSNGYSSLLSLAGIQPTNIASVLNTVGDTGFRYFNIQDSCRSRAACDLGHMLYKKLSFIHNWLVRTSVRTLTDMNNIYTQSWMEGMLGRNCTAVFLTCRQSPLEGLMNLAMLQSLAM